MVVLVSCILCVLLLRNPLVVIGGLLLSWCTLAYTQFRNCSLSASLIKLPVPVPLWS